MLSASPTIEHLESWARQAGSLLRAGYGQAHTIRHKGRVNLVTEVDHLSEEYLLKQIRRHFPEHTIIAEESGSLAGSPAQCWYIDPLDGTTNYAHGLPFFAVSIAYAEEGVIRLGAIYDPMQDELFSAELDEGAWLNGQPIHCSQVGELIHSLLVTGLPYDLIDTPHNNLDNFTHLTRLTQAVRRMGSAALELCYVAAGRFDGYWEIRLGPWDLAAGMLIARQAGAIVTDLHGSPDVMRPPHAVLAANPHLHAEILKRLNVG
jgi:myo-inositol-1(or 4)-monophosphatase